MNMKRTFHRAFTTAFLSFSATCSLSAYAIDPNNPSASVRTAQMTQTLASTIKEDKETDWKRIFTHLYGIKNDPVAAAYRAAPASFLVIFWRRCDGRGGTCTLRDAKAYAEKHPGREILFVTDDNSPVPGELLGLKDGNKERKVSRISTSPILGVNHGFVKNVDGLTTDTAEKAIEQVQRIEGALNPGSIDPILRNSIGQLTSNGAPGENGPAVNTRDALLTTQIIDYEPRLGRLPTLESDTGLDIPAKGTTSVTPGMI